MEMVGGLRSRALTPEECSIVMTFRKRSLLLRKAVKTEAKAKVILNSLWVIHQSNHLSNVMLNSLRNACP